MSKERKKYKRTKCNLWRTGKIQKKYKNTNCIFGRNGKIQKKYKNTKCIFFVFYLYFVRTFFVFLQKNTKKIQKKYECNCSKIQNTKKIRINNFKNTKYKKNTNPKFQKYKIQRKDKFKNKPESQPRVHFWKSGTKIQKNTKPTSCIFQTLQFWFCIFGLYFFRIFFVFLNIGRRPFCSHPGQLNIISCYIPAVMGHPKDASGCHCVLLFCHLMYCHLPNSSPWHLRRFTKSPSHSEYHLVLSCHSSVHMAHWKSSNNFKPSLFFHSLCIRSSLHSTPSRPPPAVSGAPGLLCPQHPRWRPWRGAAPGWRCGRRQPRGAVVSNLRRRRARRRQRLEGLEGSTPWLSTAHPPLQWEKLQSVEWSLSKLYSELVQWQPLSLLVFVKITKTTNWWNLPQQKIRKRENSYLTPITKLISTYLKHSQALFCICRL